MATVLRSSVGIILPVLQARIIQVTGLDASAVVIDTMKEAEDDETHYQADVVIFIREESSSPTGVFKAMGRIWATEDTKIVCPIWTRLALDNPPGFQAGLTDLTLGHDVWEGRVQDALYGFEPEDADGNWLAQNPLQPANGQGPRRRTKKDWTWAWSQVAVTLTYAPALDQTFPW